MTTIKISVDYVGLLKNMVTIYLLTLNVAWEKKEERAGLGEVVEALHV